MVRVKFCGMTRVRDVEIAASLGVDAVGFIFYKKSPRCVTVEKVKELLKALPPFVTSVGVFAEEDEKNIEAILKQVPLDLLQFHGKESPSFCAQFGKPYIKALPMKEGVDIISACLEYEDAKALLLDTYDPHQLGGQGRSFNWTLIPPQCPKPLILAGGLNVSNIKEAVNMVKPYGVDINSGIETKPGEKDETKMKAFMKEINSV